MVGTPYGTNQGRGSSRDLIPWEPFLRFGNMLPRAHGIPIVGILSTDAGIWKAACRLCQSRSDPVMAGRKARRNPALAVLLPVRNTLSRGSCHLHDQLEATS